MRDYYKPTQSYTPMIIYRTIFESYTPDNTHLMREYMLHVIIQNIRRMHKHKTISNSTFNKFRLMNDTKVSPENQSKDLKSFLSQVKRNHRTQDPELLQFDSTIESGNLERVEAQPISQKYVDM